MSSRQCIQFNLLISNWYYINVFNYHQQYRVSMEALGWDLLSISHSEVGANRKHRSNRFLTVIQYCLDITKCFVELLRLSHPKSRFVFVVGRESTVRGVSFNNGEIVCDVACKIMGCRLVLRQERVFTNRFGQRIIEDILHFVPPQRMPDKPHLTEARTLAYSTLQAALHRADADKSEEIGMAIRSVMKIQPSPLFTLSDTHKNSLALC